MSSNLTNEIIESSGEMPNSETSNGETLNANICQIEQQVENEIVQPEEPRVQQYERNNQPEEVTINKIFSRAFRYSLFNDLLHLTMLYAYCTMDHKVKNLMVSKCILIKIVLWCVHFFLRAIVQPYLDFQKFGHGLLFTPNEFEQFTICKSKVYISYTIFTMVVFFFADIYIISQFIPVEKSCDIYPINMCVTQKVYSIICLSSYSSAGFIGIAMLFAMVAPYLQKYTNEINYALNVAGLQHLQISSDNEDKNCSICFEDMMEATKLPCGHMYHEKCIDGWLKEKGTCPTCFQPAFNKKTTDLHIYTGKPKYVETKNEISEHPANEIV